MVLACNKLATYKRKHCNGAGMQCHGTAVNNDRESVNILALF